MNKLKQITFEKYHHHKYYFNQVPISPTSFAQSVGSQMMPLRFNNRIVLNFKILQSTLYVIKVNINLIVKYAAKYPNYPIIKIKLSDLLGIELFREMVLYGSWSRCLSVICHWFGIKFDFFIAPRWRSLYSGKVTKSQSYQTFSS